MAKTKKPDTQPAIVMNNTIEKKSIATISLDDMLQQDGLHFDSGTHEWYKDNTCTNYARKNSTLWGLGTQKDGLNVACFIVKNKATGEYDRVMLDVEKNGVIFSTKSLEDMGAKIDMLKVLKRFEINFHEDEE